MRVEGGPPWKNSISQIGQSGPKLFFMPIVWKNNPIKTSSFHWLPSEKRDRNQIGQPSLTLQNLTKNVNKRKYLSLGDVFPYSHWYFLKRARLQKLNRHDMKRLFISNHWMSSYLVARIINSFHKGNERDLKPNFVSISTFVVSPYFTIDYYCIVCDESFQNIWYNMCDFFKRSEQFLNL